MRTLPTTWAYALTAGTGAAGWILISEVSNRREAWDSELYFTWFLPLLCFIAVAIGFFAPTRPWRWGLVPFAAQAVVVVIQNPTGNLLPLGLIVFAVFGGIVALPAWSGAALRRWLERSAIT